MKSIQKCDCNYLARFAVSDSFIRDNSFRGLLAIFMVTIFVPGTAFSELYVNNANDPGCYAVVDDNNLNFKGRITGIVTNHIYCNTLTEANLNTNGGSYLLADKAGSQGTLPPPGQGHSRRPLAPVMSPQHTALSFKKMVHLSTVIPTCRGVIFEW